MTEQTLPFDRQSQTEAILRHLQSGRAITFLDALNLYGCARCGARIWDLRKVGHQIESVRVKLGSGKYVASYRLVRQ